ncbi:Na+/H+ antiporter NhaC [Virgibacillus necropolis]|uniref:Na+/H+ antiporter NhaC n=1 Tax=Virgibacillus necropolis TaxID=163877 RepID=A0A221MEX8_9BACI|nr:Na+/H+ antiporter NhaC [Virgibacillus necropolis]ASN06172.1 Na+/H+ antiporter NhaC [Virgibacillus necropolis]
MNTKLSTFKALFLLIISFTLILVGVLYLGAPSTIVLISTGTVVIALAVIWGIKWQKIEEDLIDNLKTMFKPILILLAVGMLIGSWMLSGTIPLIVYYGLLSINPIYFLFITAIICSLMSIMAGTSWGTIGTVGVALIGVSVGFGIPVYYTAGAIVVGAIFGDKLSPLSDTTVMSSAMANVELVDHIKHLLWTTIPGYIISLVLYLVLGFQFGGNTGNSGDVELILSTLKENFNLNPILIIPPIIVLVLIYFKKPTLPVFAIGILSGCLLAIFFQGKDILEVANVLNSGFQDTTSVPLVDEMLQRGGLSSMLDTVALLIGAAIFGSPLQTAGVIKTMLDKFIRLSKSAKTMMASSLTLHALFFTITGSYYVTYAVLGPAITPLYSKYGLHNKNWSRTMEDTGTALAPIIPWGVTGAFIADTLQVSTGEYILYAPMTYLGMIFALIYIFSGFGIAKTQTDSLHNVDVRKSV